MRPPAQAGHTTYRIAEEPAMGVLWTYAEPAGSGWKRLGGGAYDPATNTYGQGAFNADDVARAAVVYLRDWQQTRSLTSRSRAFQAAARPGVPADGVRAARRRGRAVDAARRHAQPERRPGRACPTRPTAATRTGSPARSGRSARATRRSGRATPRSPPSCASAPSSR
nr:hypothetical protein [Angustibacter aerolatus]